MKIKGTKNDYNVIYEQYGYAYVPMIYVMKKYPIIPLSRWVMHPTQMKRKFKEAVGLYEDYIYAWKKENAMTRTRVCKHCGRRIHFLAIFCWNCGGGTIG